MEVVFEALKRSSLSPAEKILWEIDARLADSYSILDGIEGPVSSGGNATEDWNEVAEALARRMERMPTGTGEEDDEPFLRDYHRQYVMRFLIESLENAGRKREVISLLEREVRITGCYDDLVDRLISARRKKEAVEWAREGFEKTIEKLAGIAWALEDKLRGMAQRAKAWPLVAAYRALEFVDRPGISRYSALEKSAKAAKAWPSVRAGVLYYLETGRRPDIQPSEASTPSARRGKGATKSAKSRPPKPWPLPSTGLRLSTRNQGWRQFPDTDSLIDIAINEKRNDDVLRWRERDEKRSGFWRGANDDKIAQAVQKTHPDIALQLWKRLAETQIAQIKPSAYEVAGAYLRKIEKVYRREKRLGEWRNLLAIFRGENKRRPRMIDVLNALEGKRTRILDR